jgi:hypothetical protein
VATKMPSRQPQERTMDRLRPFQATAREGGFVELNESGDGTVLWLKKSSRDASREIHERMCIDNVTSSATVFWVSSAGGLNSKTFRNAVSLEEWLKVRTQSLVETRHNPTPILLETRRQFLTRAEEPQTGTSCRGRKDDSQRTGAKRARYAIG